MIATAGCRWLRMAQVTNQVRYIALLLLVLFTFSGALRAEEPLHFLSTQLTPVYEAEKMRNVILKDYEGSVDFQPYDDRKVFQSVVKGEGVTASPGLIGGLHGDFVGLREGEALKNLSGLLPSLSSKHINKKFITLGSLESKKQYFIPWMQATYIMAAHRRALKYLPKGAKLNSLTYEQIKVWAANMHRVTGEAKLGFPVGRKGLMHRFLQGYLYPSFTGTMVGGFKGENAHTMWRFMKQLWEHVNLRSLTYTEMDDPLLSGDVWVAWDHTARLMEAFKQKPDDYIAFPAPAGPKGRGFMVVLAGLGIPSMTPDSEASERLISYLTEPEVQLKMLESVGFFPVVQSDQVTSLPKGLEKVRAAVSQQSSAPDALPTLLPVGLEERSGDFNLLYLQSFTKIVLGNLPIEVVLEKQAERMNKLLNSVNAHSDHPMRQVVAPVRFDNPFL